MAVLLAWVQVADPLVLYEGVIPLVVVCAIRVYRRRGTLRESWYELSLAAGAIVSVGAASAALKLIHYLGGFVVRPPTATFAVVDTLYSNVWVAVESVLLLFGADFSGEQLGPHAAIALVHLAGVALAVWATWRALRRFGTQDLVVQVLAVTAVVLLVAYVVRGTRTWPAARTRSPGCCPSERSWRAGCWPGRSSAGGSSRCWCCCWSATPGSWCTTRFSSVRPIPTRRSRRGWPPITSSYGLGDYWNANTITLDSGNQVQVRYVSRVGDRLVDRPWETKNSWYDPAQHDATFLVTPGPADVCSPGTPAGWQAVARATFGPPSATYHVDGFFVLVWHENLLSKLGTAPMHGPVQC